MSMFYEGKNFMLENPCIIILETDIPDFDLLPHSVHGPRVQYLSKKILEGTYSLKYECFLMRDCKGISF